MTRLIIEDHMGFAAELDMCAEEVGRGNCLLRIRLLKSTPDLRCSGQPLPGLPLFESGRADIDVVANLWVVWMATSGGLARNTAWAYAKSLRAFLESFDRAAPGLSWKLVSESDVIKFKFDRAEPIARDGGPPSRADADTIALNLFGVSSFFGFAADKGFISMRPFLVKRRRGANKAFPGCPVVTAPRSTAKRIVVLRPDEFQSIRANLRIADEDARQCADLIMLWAWGTGLRLSEACGLSRSRFVQSVLSAHRAAGGAGTGRVSLREAFSATTAEAYTMDLVPEFTKGRRGGCIAIPRDLVKATIDCLEVRGRASTDAAAGIDPLFLNARRAPVNPDTIGRYYRTAASSAGSDANFHALRHSYATRTLSLFHAAGKEVAGLLFLKAQLRHVNLETTRKYVHVLQMHAHAHAAHMVVNTNFRAGRSA